MQRVGGHGRWRTSLFFQYHQHIFCCLQCTRSSFLVPRHLSFKPTFIYQQRASFSGIAPFCVRPTVYLTRCHLLHVYKRTSHAESFFFKALFSLKKPARGSSPAAILFPDRSKSFRLVRSCNSRGMLPVSEEEDERYGLGRNTIYLLNVVEDYVYVVECAIHNVVGSRQVFPEEKLTCELVLADVQRDEGRERPKRGG